MTFASFLLHKRKVMAKKYMATKKSKIQITKIFFVGQNVFVQLLINYLLLFLLLDRADNYCSQTQTYIIIFSVCGVVLVIAIVIAIVCFVVVRRKRAAKVWIL